MKILLLCIILSCVFTVSIFGDLTPQDLEKIGEKTDEQIQNAEKRMITHMTQEIQNAEKSMKTHMTQEREKTDIKIQALDKLIERNFYFLIGLIALIAVAIAIPYRKDKKQDDLVHEVERLTKKVETQHENFVQEIERLTKEMETLKHQQTSTGS